MSTAERIDPLLARLKAGDTTALAELFAHYRASLGRMIEYRLDPRLAGRLSTSDVLQEAYLDALKRVPHFFEKPDMPFYVWLRQVTGQRLIDLHRRHLGAAKRNAAHEVSLDRPWGPGATSVCLAAHLVGSLTSPSRALQRAELQAQVEAALDSLEPIDREVLLLRHFEELSNADTAAVLGIETAAASKRYVRALERLKGVLADSGPLEFPS